MTPVTLRGIANGKRMGMIEMGKTGVSSMAAETVGFKIKIRQETWTMSRGITGKHHANTGRRDLDDIF